MERKIKYGANGAVYYEEVETPVVEEKKQVIPEFFVGEDYDVDLTAAEYTPKKKKNKKRVIQEVFADNEDL